MSASSFASSHAPAAGSTGGPSSGPWQRLLPACVVTSMATSLAARQMTPAERASLDVVDCQREAEFAAGRHHLRSAFARLQIRCDDLPRSAARTPALPPGAIASVAHTADARGVLVAAAAARVGDVGVLGIDAEATANVQPRLWERFLDDRELGDLLAHPVPERLARAAHYWCAKEAAAKATGVHGEARRVRVEFRYDDVDFSAFVARIADRVVNGRACTWQRFSLAAVAARDA
ncbi:MAG: 4'-phosphopantetheinyl transferase superfamily protein [Rhizobacter sp.]|nr:4'-phosphopantetheinyl transferase superfamily protein [Rhizobacter sp.]